MVAEVATTRMLVVLNKIDLLPEADRGKAVRKAAKRLGQTLAMTRFASSPLVPVAAKSDQALLGIEDVKAQLIALVPGNPREPKVMLFIASGL